MAFVTPEAHIPPPNAASVPATPAQIPDIAADVPPGLTSRPSSRLCRDSPLAQYRPADSRDARPLRLDTVVFGGLRVCVGR